MGQVEIIPFSGLVAGMLLYKRICTSVDITNLLSKLEQLGIMIDDENDSFDELFCCVEVNYNFDFYLKNGMDYETVLSSGIKVVTFLKEHTSEEVLRLLSENVKNFISVEQLLQNIYFIETSKEIQNKKGIFSEKSGKILSRIKTKASGIYSQFLFEKEKNEVARTILR